jgi:hypothetical protein
MMASGNKVLDQLQNVHALLEEPPTELLSGAVPTRVLGYGSSQSLAAEGEGGAVLGYEGDGLPAEPGFGLALVDDSSEVFRGVLVFEVQPPPGFPQIGTISSATSTLPLFGLRIHWSSVNSDQCPLFVEQADTTSA